MFRVLFIAALGLLFGGAALAKGTAPEPIDQPPAGITATSGVLADILAAHERAIGRLEPGAKDTSREHWTFTDMGLSGSEELVRSGTDYRSSVTAGPFHEEYGQAGEQRWHRNANGAISAVKSEDSGSFVMLRVLEDAADPKNDVKVLGEVASPKPAYVLEVRRPGYKHPKWVFYDKQTFLIGRVELAMKDLRLASIYDDYRTTHGVTQPWHVRDAYSHSYLDDDWRRVSLTIGEAVDPKEFAEPAVGRSIEDFDGTVSLPSKIVDGNVILRVTVNGRGLDFALSTAAPYTIIDRDVARELNLPTYGQVTSVPGEGPVGYKTILRAADLGPLHLHDVVVRAVHFNYHINGETKIVGVLGFDLLAGAVMHIDYVKGKVELIDARRFDGSGLGSKPAVLPLKILDGIPYVECRIGASKASHMILDNDDDFTVIFGGFSSRYPDDVRDVSGRSHASYTVPFADSSNFGVRTEVWSFAPPHFVIGPVDFQTVHLFATNSSYEVAGEEADGVIGADVLNFYDVYVDFPHDRVILLPNEFFFKAFKIQKQ